ncbi:hypothetical protein EYF80_017559 [Liparis tanakae]|uniref:Uncharacterized protein n=1 Tax=Liparis tanakae TaxID=230148 RepID=A0A4Z2I496_9TELE|nr:hypothetical protein EYF80_017559 [Liparis tanakae]
MRKAYHGGPGSDLAKRTRLRKLHVSVEETERRVQGGQRLKVSGHMKVVLVRQRTYQATRVREDPDRLRSKVLQEVLLLVLPELGWQAADQQRFADVRLDRLFTRVHFSARDSRQRDAAVRPTRATVLDSESGLTYLNCDGQKEKKACSAQSRQLWLEQEHLILFGRKQAESGWKDELADRQRLVPIHEFTGTTRERLEGALQS